MHSRTVCARGGLWWNSGWGIWRFPPQTYSPSYPAYWQISTQLLSAGPEGRPRERTENNETITTLAATVWPTSSKQCGRVESANHGGKSMPTIKTESVQSISLWKYKVVLVLVFYLMSQHPVELLFRDDQPLSVCAVHHQNDELQSRRQKSHWVTSFQKTFTAIKYDTAGGHFRAKAPHNGSWWLLC